MRKQKLGGRGEGAQIMYTRVSKCKNNKIKLKKRKKKPGEVLGDLDEKGVLTCFLS
jgi:hypothetical protein